MRQSSEAVTRVEGLRATRILDLAVAELSLDDRRFQYRPYGARQDLLPSLAAEGQREPIDVWTGEPHVVIDGFRRLDAIRELGWSTVKAVVHEGLSEDQAHSLAFVKNVVRRNLSPLEKANAVDLAKKRGKSMQEIARHLGLSKKQVRRYLALVTFPPSIQGLLEGSLSMAHAKVLADSRVSDPSAWAERSIAVGWSAKELRRELEKTAGARRPGRKRAYVKRDGRTLRVYAFTIKKDAPKTKRERVARLLREAASFLES